MSANSAGRTLLRWTSRLVYAACTLWFTWAILATSTGRPFVARSTGELISFSFLVLIVLLKWINHRWPLPDPARGGEAGRVIGTHPLRR